MGEVAAAPEKKRKATTGAAAALEQMSSGRAAHAPEQNRAKPTFCILSSDFIH
ncbi:hypothetical protein C2845_PM01G31000 [Panicum miliaceum]|uniref:Uncharacterized protein n=1 Tax=Panicum miliaceum TaxID=4540 RepID=A0A3L6TUV0_PANMI|nr:hypothetical protein C2845_PM01G31000 [Panicum miliaceum]